MNEQHIQKYQSWVAIDVAKDFNYVNGETLDGKSFRNRFSNNYSGYDSFIQILNALPKPCRIGLEATGNYHRTIAYRLVKEGFEVCFISSLASARYREVLFNSWDKNDTKDASVLLKLLKQGVVQSYVDPIIFGHHDLQELSKTYSNITLNRTRLQHSILNHYLPLYFPEMQKWWNSTRADWWIKYLLQFPTPESIKCLSFQEFKAIASSLIGRKVNKDAKLIELYDTAHNSIGLPILKDSLACQTFRVQLQRYHELCQRRTQIEHMAEQALAGRRDYEILTSVPGIGSVIALTILAEAGDLRRFSHHKQFLKYCGLDLAKNQSGSMRGIEKLSKRGNARLRSALWMA